jgi:hypothetical protein
MSSKLELLKAANRHYPDGQLASYFDEKTGKLVEPAKGEGGDTLAQFIVVELSEAADTPQEAVRLMERAQDDIREAIIGLLELTD